MRPGVPPHSGCPSEAGRGPRQHDCRLPDVLVRVEPTSPEDHVMRHRSRLGILFAAAAIALSLVSLSCGSNQQVAATMPKPDPVVRGRYLVTIMSCNDCHTPGFFYGAPDTLRRLSGSEIG